jgi:hypothetical protein
MTDLRAFISDAKRSRDLGTRYPGARLITFPVPHLDFTQCDDPILQYCRYFADHPGPYAPQAIRFLNGLHHVTEGTIPNGN